MGKPSSFLFLRTWPRAVFGLRNGNKLLVKSIEQLDRPGVYILYCGEEPWYVGKADCLFSRLHDHANKMTDRYYPHWDHFSAFVFPRRSQRSKRKAGEIEGILIAAIPQVRNSSTPRWKKFKLPSEIRKALKQLEFGGERAIGAAAGR